MTFPLPAAALAQHCAILGKTRSGKSSAMRLIVEHLLDEGQPVCIIDPKGDWYGLRSGADGKSAGYPVVIFGGEHADVPINAHAGAAVAELVATGNRPCIIDFGGWMVGERTRFFVDFASNLFRSVRGSRYLVIDEVHNFAPQGKILDPDAGKMLHWANRLASEGSGKGITLISASQRPQKVHKDFLTCSETLIAMRVIHPLDRAAIKDWIDGCADAAKGREVLASLASMPRGEAWVWSPEIDFGPKRLKFPKFATFDSFAPRAADDSKLKGWAEVDLADVKDRLSAIVAEKEANDPKALRARIAELERQPRAADPQAVDRAYMRGKGDGYKAALADIGATIDVRALRGTIAGLDRQLVSLHEALQKAKPAEAWPAGIVSAPAVKTEQRAANSCARDAVTGLPRAERLILAALAQYRQGRTKSQIAILAGYAQNGGSFNNSLSSLRSKSWITRTDPILITADGLSALGPYEPLPHGPALLGYWYGQLAKAERKALEALADAYPKSLSKAQVAAASGYEANGGSFNNALSKLRTLELIKGRGEMRAAEEFFE